MRNDRFGIYSPDGSRLVFCEYGPGEGALSEDRARLIDAANAPPVTSRGSVRPRVSRFRTCKVSGEPLFLTVSYCSEGFWAGDTVPMRIIHVEGLSACIESKSLQFGECYGKQQTH